MWYKYPTQNVETLYKCANYLIKNNQHVRKIYKNMVRSIEEAIYTPPLPLQPWKKIDTLKKTEQKKVDWDALSYATPKATCNLPRWETILAENKITTGKVMHNQGSWSTSACRRNCGHAKEDTPHIFQCKKEMTCGKNSKKTLVRRVIKNRAEPTLITALLQGISLCHKVHLPPPPHNLPTQVE